MNTESRQSQLACLYARVSSELQKKERTIDSQLAEVRNAIHQNDDVLVQEYTDDGYSGELLERPALDRLRNDAGKGQWSKIYILSPDRLARKPHIGGLVIDELQDKGIEVVFINRPLGHTIEDQLLFGVQSLFAEYEKEKFKERQRRGKIFKARKGSIVGGKAPYGYGYIRDPKTGEGRYVIDSAEASVVRLIYRCYTSGYFYGFRSIIRELYKRAIRTRMGRRKWGHATIKSILTDPTYTGTTYYNRRRRVPAHGSGTAHYRRSKNTCRVYRDRAEWIPISVPAIVTKELQKRAGEIRQKNKKLSRRNAKEQYLLKNLIKCGKCGCAFYAYSTGRATQKRYCFYTCSYKVRAFPVTTSHTASIGRNAADTEIWNALKRVLGSPPVLAALVNEQIQAQQNVQADLNTELEEITARLQHLEAKRVRTLEAYNGHAISLDELKSLTDEYKKQKDILLKEKAQLEERPASGANAITVETARALMKRYAAKLRNANFEARRKVVQEIVREIVAYRDKLTVNCAVPAIPKPQDLHPIAVASLKRCERNSCYAFRMEIPIRGVRGRFVRPRKRAA